MADTVLSSTPAAICSCGATERHASAGDRCSRGHVLVGNATARKHGVDAFEARGPVALPTDLRVTVDEFRAQVIRDRGGVDSLTAIEAGYVRRLAELETVARLLATDLAGRGLMTAKGRVRSTFSRWLEALDRWDRYAQRVGMDRRPKAVQSLDEYLRNREAAPLTTETEDPDAGE